MTVHMHLPTVKTGTKTPAGIGMVLHTAPNMN